MKKTYRYAVIDWSKSNNPRPVINYVDGFQELRDRCPVPLSWDQNVKCWIGYAGDMEYIGSEV